MHLVSVKGVFYLFHSFIVPRLFLWSPTKSTVSIGRVWRFFTPSLSTIERLIKMLTRIWLTVAYENIQNFELVKINVHVSFFPAINFQ